MIASAEMRHSMVTLNQHSVRTIAIGSAQVNPQRIPVAPLVPETRKPFDMFAEGPLVLSSRDDRTAIELFLGGVRALETGIRRRLNDRSNSDH